MKEFSTEAAETQRAQRESFLFSSLCPLCLCVLCACLSSSCASGGGSASAEKFPDYNVIRLYNDSPAEIYEVELLAGGHAHGAGQAPRRPFAPQRPRREPGPADRRGELAHAGRPAPAAEVPIAPALPAGFRGVIVLRLKPNGDVDVQFVPYRDLR